MRALALLSLLALFQISGAAPTVGLNFSNSTVSTTMAGGTADGFNGWTDSRPNGSTTTAHIQSSPLALGTGGVTATWSASSTFSGGDNVNKEQTPYRLYLDDGGSGVRVTIQGLAAWLGANGMDAYQIRCYASSDNASGFQTISIRSGTSSSGTVLHTMTPPILGNGSFPTGGTVPVSGVTRGYVDSPKTLTEDSITLTIPPRPPIGNVNRNVRGSLAAFKITAFKTPVAQTITFGAVAPATVGDAPVTLSASASSGLPVTVTSSNPTIASVSGMTLNFHAAGTVTLTARQTGNADFLPAPEVQRSLRVYSGIKIPQTISFTDPGDPVHGDLSIAVTASSSSGLPLVFSSSDPAVATVEAGRLIARFPGNTTITASQPGDLEFHPATPVAHSITVLPGLLDLPAQLRYTVARGAPEFTAEVPVVSRSGQPLAWTATLAGAPLWLDLPDPAGGTPGTLRLVLSPNSARAGEQSAELRIAAGGKVFAIPVILTVESALPVDRYGLAGSGPVPVTASAFTATGREANFDLSHAPETGAELMVVNVTGGGFIQGTFANLPQGARVELPFGGRIYPFVANYFGGDGNDLVLQWANVRLVSWGLNSYGQLGDGSRTDRLAPVAVASDRLAGRTPLMAEAGGAEFSMALAADGSAFSWGEGSNGKLGNGDLFTITNPHPLKQNGVLLGKTIVSLAVSGTSAVALCSDGTLAQWGDLSGQFSSGTREPELVDRGGLLAGKTVVAIANGGLSRLALCSDGTLVAWGNNNYGTLGTGNLDDSDVPVAVLQTGALAGKTVRSIAAGYYHYLVLCEDGTLVAGGANTFGQLGTGTTDSSNVPIRVNQSGVLAGKTVVAIDAGSNHSMALCSDGTVVAWGSNDQGRLGATGLSQSTVPRVVSRTGALAGKSVLEIRAGDLHSLALCSDGTIAAWGGNTNGQLGNGTTTASSVPVAVSNASLKAGERFTRRLSAASHNLAQVAVPLAPHATTLVAKTSGGGTVLRGMVNPHDRPTSVRFEYGLTTALGGSRAATPASLAGSAFSPVELPLEDLMLGTTYYYRVVATSANGTSAGEIRSFATGSQTMLAGLVADSGHLTPAFQGKVTRYSLTVSPQTTAVSLSATASDPSASVSVNGQAAVAGNSTATVPLATGVNPITVTVSGASGALTYRIDAVRLPAAFTFTSVPGTPLQSQGFDVRGLSASFSLGFTPVPGTAIRVLENTGSQPIVGTFANLPQGAPVLLTRGGIEYRFAADYFGGDGNDLVLRWANQRILAWGENSSGELGDGSEATRAAPSPGDPEALFAGAAIRSISAGTGYSVALLVDGRMAAWGLNDSGQLGNGGRVNSNRPVWVDTEGVLAGKTVVRVACGVEHTLALCSDGTLVAWGEGTSGQLGYGGRNSSAVPVRVVESGALAGKRVVGLAAGYNHSLALCEDGSLVYWGSKLDDNFGSGGTISDKPSLLEPGPFLDGKSLVEISGGPYFNLVRSSDGALFSWGGAYGQALGHFVNGPSSNTTPFPVNATDALFGRPVVAMSSRGSSNLVLGADGRLVVWGGSAGFTVPALVDASGVLAGRTVEQVACGALIRLVKCSDNTLASWEQDVFSPGVPALVDLAALKANERLASIAAGDEHFLMLVDSPPAPQAVTLAATDITDASAVLRARVKPNGGAATVVFEFGPTPAYGQTIAATPSQASGTGEIEVSAAVGGLVAGTDYHFRVVATGNGGTARGEGSSFRTTEFTSLAGLSLSHGTISPAFDSRTTAYHVAVPSNIESIVLTPLAKEATSTVRVAGSQVSSGSPSAPQPLVVGNNPIPIDVIAPGGGNSTAYRLTVTRLPGSAVLDGSGTPSLTVEALAPGGNPLPLSLGFAPPVGTRFTLVNVTGPSPILGRFSGLAQGQFLTLEHDGVAYGFIVNYHGGDGNDLVLQWAHTRPISWGSNTSGQLGIGSAGLGGIVPVPVSRSGILAGKTVIAMTGGDDHSLALCSDGTLASWGNGISARLGRGPGAPSNESSSLPVAVYQGGILAGKTVVALTAGTGHSLVLCTDGSLAAWGDNYSGQLGDGTTPNYTASPVAVNSSGVLAGRRVVGISVRRNLSLAVCDDGRVAAWGPNNGGQLGTGNTTTSKVPVLVDHTGVLAGKRVVSAAAGGGFALALCDDGSLVTWGSNNEGQLGNGTISATPSLPVLVDRSGVLAGKTVVGIAAGDSHALAWCSDGTLAAWGVNNGRLGDGTTVLRSSPVLVNRSGVLAGKTVVKMIAGMNDSVALCSDGTVAHWGTGFSSGVASNLPVALNLTSFAPGERVIEVGIGAAHGLAVVAMPPPPRQAETLAATSVTDTSATLHGRASGNGSTAAVRFEYGLTPALGKTAVPAVAEISGTAVAGISVTLEGLLPGTTYHYRLMAANSYGSVAGEIGMFTTSRLADLAGLSLDRGSLTPAFSAARLNYEVTLPADATEIRLTPVALEPAATVTVNGIPASPAVVVPLASNVTAIPVTVTSADQLNTRTYQITVTRLPQTLDLTADSQAAVRAGGFSLGGTSPGLLLGSAPVPGASLTVLVNTGLGMIAGRFDNLIQGRTVFLGHGGVEYPYVVNYFGGSGNDLVLEWANTRLFSWGSNANGQLGDGTATTRLVPSPVDGSGGLAGRAVIGGASGEEHSAVLCADGSLFAWGRNFNGQLATGTGTGDRSRPVEVTRSGALAGKQIAAIAVGRYHNLVLCDDGTVFGWGANGSGELGDGSSNNIRYLPVATTMTGVLAGKRVVALSAGTSHSLALCDDGTLAAWGYNNGGQLGNGTLVNSPAPVAVDQSGVLSGKQVIAIAAGHASSYALCSDGTVASWGGNSRGQLGDDSTVTRLAPVLVRNDGVLAGKTVVAIAAGTEHLLALCADGTLAAWGSGGNLGNGTSTDSDVPVLVNRAGVLAGKVVRSIHAASYRSFAMSDDGTLAAWGNNGSGALGNNSSTSATTPVAASMVNLTPGERMLRPLTSTYSQSNLALIASPVPARATTLAAGSVIDSGAVLHGSVNANGQATTLSFEYGPTAAYGFTIAASPATSGGVGVVPVSAVLANLTPATTYHFRLVAAGSFGATRGENQSFTTSDLATLASLGINAGVMVPDFDPLIGRYHAVVPPSAENIAVTAVARHPGAAIEVNGSAVASGSASAPILLTPGDNEILIAVTAAGGASRMDYRITITRVPATFTYRSAGDAGIRVPAFSGTGMNAAFALDHAPAPGTPLRVVEQSGLRPIQGEFDNLAQGQQITLVRDGVAYRFVANYFGGDGNDLVLHWADTVVSAWGRNQEGQLGNGSTTNAPLQGPVDLSGVLAGKTITAVAGDYRHSLALCSDGTLVAWGRNSSGELGDGTTTSRSRPVLVKRDGALAGKSVVAIAAGGTHSLALCSDGSLFSWGSNESGKLGNGGGASSSVPVPVTTTGALAGKRPVAISCSGSSNLVLCEDGSLVSWGANFSGQLGLANFTGSGSDVPRGVDATGDLAGRQVIRISAGANHMMALCSDGSLAAWGNHQSNLWGNGNTSRSVPTLVPAAGLFSGKKVVDISLGADHGLALCDDQSLIAWGSNSNGRLGNNSTTSPGIPVLVDRTGILAGRQVVRVIARDGQSLAVCADGTVAAWGLNASGELGNGGTTQSLVPAWVLPGAESPAAATVAISPGVGSHSLRIAGAPPAPQVVTREAADLADFSATLRAEVNANGGETAVFFEFGTSPDYGQLVAATPAQASGISAVEVSAPISGLLPGTTYHFRVLARKGGLTRFGEDRTFTTTEQSTLAALTLEGATLNPGFSKRRFQYLATVPFATAGIRVTTSATSAEAVVRVNGNPLPSGATSPLLPLAVGANPITVEVVSGGAAMTSLYQVVVTRLPEVFALNSPSQVPLTLEGFVASGFSVPLALQHAPAAGADLTLIRNPGGVPIQGSFDNLQQGQVVRLVHGNTSYPFVVNYRGGAGFDLVLHWANHRATAWGRNDSGQLGDLTTSDRNTPVKMALPPRTLLRVDAGERHGLALFADGSINSWGYNTQGRLGRVTGSFNNPDPGPVDSEAVFGGEPVTSIATGTSHGLALGFDGTLASWGYNNSGQLGDGTTTTRSTPVRVVTTGALAGKRVMAIAAGGSHSLALCADGTLAAWGLNGSGQLGNGNTIQSSVPVRVDLSGVLAGKRIVAISAGENHSLALCSDGTLAAWGNNSSGQFGNGSTTSSQVPVAVASGGALAGKTIVAIAPGNSHALGLASDGTLAAWGANHAGQLGNATTTNSNLPVLVSRGGILGGKKVVGIEVGTNHSLAWCEDGTLAAWGENLQGNLGIGSTTNSNVPVEVSRAGLAPGERRGAAAGGLNFSLGLVAMPSPPEAETLAATAIRDTAATLHARVNGNGAGTALSFEYGPTAAYGNVLAANPATLASAGGTAVSAQLTGLLSGTTYHFRVVATSAGGTAYGEDRTFTTSSLASLAALATDAGTLSPGFDPRQPSYVVTVPHATTSISLTAGLAEASSTLVIDGQPAVPGVATGPFVLMPGNRVIPLVVTLADGSFSQTYEITVTRLPAVLALAATTQPALTVPGLVAAGKPLPLSLNHTPLTGASLRLIDNTGTGPIAGRFDGMEQGGQVVLTHGGIEYRFVANYHGGDGNDLVLDWGRTRVVAVGNGDSGQLGEGLNERRDAPVPVVATGALAGRTVVALSAGADHSLALCADGGVVSWGLNTNGQLGNATQGSSNVPVDVDASGVLAGKHVVAVSAGEDHSLALCSDGTLVAWGQNATGQLGDGTFTSSQRPVVVDRGGALAGKTIAAISAGAFHNLLLCTDGTVFAWGANGSGRLGDGLAVNSPVPKPIDLRPVHGPSPIIAVAAGDAFSLALDANGIVSSWGDNAAGQLGDGGTDDRGVPGPVSRTGVFSGRKGIALQAGSAHGLVLCDDGTMVAWGVNTSGELGDGSGTPKNLPVIVQRPGSFTGKSVAVIRAGKAHNYLLATDGTLAAWGENFFGQLADGTTVDRPTIILAAAYSIDPAERFISMMGGSSSNHGLGLVAMPPAPRVETFAATQVGDSAATLHAAVSAQGNPASVVFEYGPTPDYGFTVAADPSQVTGVATAAASARVTGLRVGTPYHFRVVATGPGGTVAGEDRGFTTGVSSALAGLEIPGSTLDPSFSPSLDTYQTTLPAGSESVSLRATAASAGAVIRMNGSIVASGAASPPIPLATGENEISIGVTSADGTASQTYRIRVLRLPAEFAFATANDGAIDVESLSPAGDLSPLRLLGPPQPGTRLTLIRQSGLQPISGRFDNLAHGQTIHLSHNGITYPFVANYFGGDGNDLVLHWANVRPFTFGYNNVGQLGNDTDPSSPLPVAVETGTSLRGRAVFAMSAGRLHNLAVLDDGSIASWGYNEGGMLGDGTTTVRSEPLIVNRDGVLAGREVVAVAAGTVHSMALCADGTVAAWGTNNYGQLGDDSRTNSVLPLRIDQSGVLAGRRVVALAAGYSHSLALCSDGRVAAWGRNHKGQLGANVGLLSQRPVWVDHGGVLAGKTVVAIAAGFEHSLALCSDGTLAAWGANQRHQLGDNGTLDSPVPVNVRQGARAGKTVVAIRSGALHNFALCSDGSIVAWGDNTSGSLGIGGPTDARVPTLVSTSRVAIDIDTDDSHGLAVFADGTAAAWGSNGSGRLGNGGTSDSDVPVAVATVALPEDSRVIAGAAGENYSVILAALPPAPVVATLAATAPRDRAATLNGEVSANGQDAKVWFELGTALDLLDRIVNGTPAQATGTTSTPITGLVTGLLPGTTYHYRMVAANERGETLGEIRSFTTTTFTTLAGLAPSQGVLGPDFSPARTDYRITVPHAVDALAVTPTATHPGSPITVNGAPVASGAASQATALAAGENEISVVVTSADGLETSTYRIRVTRLPTGLLLASPVESLLTADGLSAAGVGLEFELGFMPSPGTRLRLLTLTGLDPLIGRFSNLAQGDIVGVDHEGSTYYFVVNYYGGSGNDLELQWLNSRVVAWGANNYGELGINSTSSSKLPVPVVMSGALDRYPVIQLAGNSSNSQPFGAHHFALGADGGLVGWGRRAISSQISSSYPDSRVPVALESGGALQGKPLAAISAGSNFTLMLAADGTLAASGGNYYGTLGNRSFTSTELPVAVWSGGALRGKRVVSVSAGLNHSLALCSDGTVVAWGSNERGELALDGTTSREEPRLVRGLPANQRVAAISAGQSFSLALLENGEVFGWGSNNLGQLGTGGNVPQSQTSPVPVDRSGVLAGKRIIAISAGATHSLALSEDGMIFAWGANSSGQLGNGGTTQSLVPVAVSNSGLLNGRMVTAIRALRNNSFALCSDGTLAVWGANIVLGNDISGSSPLPIAVSTQTLRPGEVFMGISTGSSPEHAVAQTALPLPVAAALAASSITGVSATLHGIVNARGNDAVIHIEYGLDESFSTAVTALPASTSGNADTPVSAAIAGLTPGTPYFYRVVAESYGGIIRSPAMSFTTLSDNAKLAGLVTAAGAPAPAFEKRRFDYVISVAHGTDRISITPFTDHPGATVEIGGHAVASGSASPLLPLTVGNNTITAVVTAEDGIAILRYKLVVTRLPAVLALDASGEPPVVVNGFFSNGLDANLRLDHHPRTGAFLTVVNNTGLDPIFGTFANLAQGQRIVLTHEGVDYAFAANYFGGTGNDLVLHWANTRIAAWGLNSYGQLGDGSTLLKTTPVAVDDSGLLAGKTLFALSGGYLHTLALCSDGTIAAWGYNVHGQLGNNGSAVSRAPGVVDASGALAGKTVVAISAGPYHNLALCSDGTLVAWGYNNYGQLGTGDTQTRRTPVIVPRLGALAGKRVTAIAAGAYHSLALCSDGSIAGWGYNDEGELGDGTTTRRMIPVAADHGGALAGKKVAMIRSGQYHSLALCTDGSVVSWGYNPRGQLGDGSATHRLSPVDVTRSGALDGRSVIDLAAGESHSLALCSDGTLAAWGRNHRGQLGSTGGGQSTLPLAVANAPAAVRIAAGAFHGLSLAADGTLGAWGDSAYGQLGTAPSLPAGQIATPDTSTIHPGSRAILIATGPAASHNLTLIALPNTASPPAGEIVGPGDKDPIPALLRYAFGLAPDESNPSRLPQPRLENGKLVTRFARPAGVTGIIYGAEWSTSLQAGSWQDIPNTGTSNLLEFMTPESDETSLFMRLKVTEESQPPP